MNAQAQNRSWGPSSAQFMALGGAAIMLAAMLAGPAFSPPEFDWVRHTTSQQAGQNMAGAFIMRVGFGGYGLGTAIAAMLAWRAHPLMHFALCTFGVGLIAAAIWSNASIIPDIPSDMFEDSVHSAASGLVGTAFAAACAICLFIPRQSGDRALGMVGLIIAITIPLAMSVAPEWQGILQRAMFAYSFAFVWRQFGNT